MKKFLIQEDKKNRLIQKYKDALPGRDDWGDLLNKIVSRDPSPTKKYAEWIIKNAIKDINNNETFDERVFYIMLGKIKDFETYKDKMNEKVLDFFKIMIEEIRSERGTNLEKYNERAIQKILRYPKDILAYESFELLEVMIGAVRRFIEDRKIQEELKTYVLKHYEDDTYLIVQPLSHNTSCYYGANTKWCTASKDTVSHFNSYSSDGTLLYIINKKSKSPEYGKMVMYIENNGNIKVYNQQDSESSIKTLYDAFEPIKSEIKTIIGQSSTYEKLKKIKQNKISNPVPLFSSDNTRIEVYDDNIYISFDGGFETFMDLFTDVMEEGELSYAKAIEGGNNYGYSDIEFYDSYSFESDFDEGYVLYYFNSEHLEVLKNILRYVNPGLSECIKEDNDKYIFRSDDCRIKISEFIAKMLDKLYEDIGTIYSDAQESAIRAGVEETLEDEFCDILDDIGVKRDLSGKKNEKGEVEKTRCFYRYFIPIDKIIEYYELKPERNSDYDIIEMLKIMIENVIMIPEIYSMQYESFDSETFEAEFNQSMLTELENYLYHIEDEYDPEEFEKMTKTLEEVKKKYGFNKKIPIQTMEGDIDITINDIDKANGKLMFTITDNDNYRIKKGLAKLSTIEALLNNYSLFSPFED